MKKERLQFVAVYLTIFRPSHVTPNKLFANCRRPLSGNNPLSNNQTLRTRNGSAAWQEKLSVQTDLMW